MGTMLADLDISVEELLDSINDAAFIPQGPVYSPVLGTTPAYSAPSVTATQTPTALTTTASTTPGTSGSYAFTMPSGFTELMVYVGDIGIANEKVILYVNNGTTTTPIHVFGWGCVCLKAVNGLTLGFGSTVIPRSANSATATAIAITVIPHKGASSQVAPSGQTVTVQPDQSSPNVWSPTYPCIVLQDEFQTIQFTSANVGQPFNQRHVFIQECDNQLNFLPIRHVYIPSGQTVNVQCRYQNIFLMTLTGEKIQVNLPATAKTSGTTIANGTSYPIGQAVDFEIAAYLGFTVTKSVDCYSNLQFQAALNNTAVNDIVLHPGTYDMTNSPITPSNYSAAMKRNLRIRGATGVATDVVFQVASPSTAGQQWAVDLTTYTNGYSSYWILDSISWNNQSCAITQSSSAPTGMLNFFGNVHMQNCYVTGAATKSNTYNADTQVKWLSGGDAVQAYVNECIFTNSSDDMVASNVQTNGGSNGTCRVDLFNNYLDGNGPYNYSQLLTNHSGGVVACWMGSFGNLTNTNASVITGDVYTSPIYLMYCQSQTANFTGSNLGVSVTNTVTCGQYLHFCDFESFNQGYGVRSIVCSTLKAVASGNDVLQPDSSCRIVGSDLYLPLTSSGGEKLIDSYGTNFSLFASRLTGYNNEFNQALIRMYDISSGSAFTGSIGQCLFRVNSGGSDGNIVLGLNGGNSTNHCVAALTNCVLTSYISGGVTALVSITTPILSTSSASHCYLQGPSSSSSITNWTTAFGTLTSVTYAGSTGPQLDGNDVALGSGNCYQNGLAGTVGSLDIYGRPFLGGSWNLGPAESTAIRSGAVLYPLVWI